MVQSGTSNKQRIVDAAQNLFYRQGYNATSFTDIARAADIPRGNFYYYFKTKDEILDSVVQRWVESLRAMLKQWESEVADPRERLVRFLYFPMQDEENLKRYGCPLGTLNTEMCKLSANMRDRGRVLFDLLVEWLEAQFAELGHGHDSCQMALGLIGRLQGASVLCSVYQDCQYLRYETKQLEQWINTL